MAVRLKPEDVLGPEDVMGPKDVRPSVRIFSGFLDRVFSVLNYEFKVF